MVTANRCNLFTSVGVKTATIIKKQGEYMMRWLMHPSLPQMGAGDITVFSHAAPVPKAGLPSSNANATPKTVYLMTRVTVKN
jgi:hypothetical protein